MELADHLERGADVGVHHRRPLVIGGLDERLVDLERGVVDQRIELGDVCEFGADGLDAVFGGEVGPDEFVDVQVVGPLRLDRFR